MGWGGTREAASMAGKQRIVGAYATDDANRRTDEVDPRCRMRPAIAEVSNGFQG